MQDADFNATNTDAYGDGIGGDVPPFPDSQPSDGASGWTELNNAGRYEFVTVTAVSGNTLSVQGTGLNNGLNYAYRNENASTTHGRRTYQIVRVPQYASATLSGVTALPWNGQVGGIVVLDVAGELTLGGGTVVDVSGHGFRGGAGRLLFGGSGQNTDYRTLATNNTNGSKGEGIAGTPRYVLDYFDLNNLDAANNPPLAAVSVIDNGVEGYPNGSYARGAPGNAGGGSTDGRPSNNDQNSGGGGGSNGGRGGRGGRTWSSQRPVGGFGGKAFNLAEINQGERLFMGGGGGAGTTNNGARSISRVRGTSYSGVLDFDASNQDFAGGSNPSAVGALYSSGAAGGGIVLLRAQSLGGSGLVAARGAPGLNTGQDGGGGGGAGGTVYVATNEGIANLTVDVQGGEGGWATFRAAHGPGGGGGGGVVISTEPGVSIAPNGLAGGQAGETGLSGNSNPPNFDGQQGTGLAARITASQNPGIQPGSACIPALTVTKTTSTPRVNNQPNGSTATYSIAIANAAERVAATNVAVIDTLPTGFTYSSTESVDLAGGALQTDVSDPADDSTIPTWGSFEIPGGGQVTITFTVTIDRRVESGTYQNPAEAVYLDPQRQLADGQATAAYDALSSDGEDVTVAGGTLLLKKRITAINGLAVNPNDQTPLNVVTEEAGLWPNNALVGATEGGLVKPGDELEYTVYFLSSGTGPITNVSICDLIPANTRFVANAFNGQTPLDSGALSGTDVGIALASSSETVSTTPTVYLTNAQDGDRGQFYPAGATLPSSCREANTNGAVVVNVVSSPDTLPAATAPGTPPNAYGFIRFRAQVVTGPD
ncbi:DUF11 domain-containing protein [Nodosilinea sp. P-1105]|uniref:DUF11 domain-containing protein n=1 Tax=Nodosilinea sp. P-1105 TaxID=2546229 RepID=UPI00198244BC|nr:DUF11 domain-containing protein [Nodosilinea sp. P-1105]